MAARTSSTKDGKLHLDDPKVRQAVIKALEYPTTAYKEGFVPSSAINWNDADDNNAFHAKQIVMDLDGTISTEVAIIKNKEDYDDIVMQGLPLDNDGKPMPAQVTHVGGMIPKGRQKHRSGEGFPEVFDPAEGHQRVSEDRARPKSAGDARRSSRATRGGTPIRTARPMSSRDCSGRRCRISSSSTRPGPRSATSTSSAPPGPTSSRTE